MFPGAKGSKRDGFSTVISTIRYLNIIRWSRQEPRTIMPEDIWDFLCWYVKQKEPEQEGVLYLVFPFDLRCFGILTKVEILNPLNVS